MNDDTVSKSRMKRIISQQGGSARIIVQKGGCPKHPAYKALREPNTACKGCLMVWEMKQELASDRFDERPTDHLGELAEETRSGMDAYGSKE